MRITNPFINVSGLLHNPNIRSYSYQPMNYQFNQSNHNSFDSFHNSSTFNSFHQNNFSQNENDKNKIKKFQSYQETAATLQRTLHQNTQNNLINPQQKVNPVLDTQNKKVLIVKKAQSLSIQTIQNQIHSITNDMSYSEHYNMNPAYKNTQILIQQFNENDSADHQDHQDRIQAQKTTQNQQINQNFKSFRKISLGSIKQVSEEEIDRINSIKKSINNKEKKISLLKQLGKNIKNIKKQNYYHPNCYQMQTNQPRFILKQFQSHLSDQSNSKQYLIRKNSQNQNLQRLRLSNNSYQLNLENHQILSERIEIILRPLLQSLRSDIFNKIDKLQQKITSSSIKINQNTKQPEKILDQSGININIMNDPKDGLNFSQQIKENDRNNIDIQQFTNKMKRTLSIEENDDSFNSDTYDKYETWNSKKKYFRQGQTQQLLKPNI